MLNLNRIQKLHYMEKKVILSCSLSIATPPLLPELSGLAAPSIRVSMCVAMAALSGSAGPYDSEQAQHGIALSAHDEALHQHHPPHQAVCVCTAPQQVHTRSHKSMFKYYLLDCK